MHRIATRILFTPLQLKIMTSLADILTLQDAVMTSADTSTSPVEAASSSTAPKATPPPDNFYSPQNYAFYT
jgi:hypothetical protein